MVDYSTLQVLRSTKEHLTTLRRPGETYDALVQRLIADASRAEEEQFLAELDAMYLDKKNLQPLR